MLSISLQAGIVLLTLLLLFSIRRRFGLAPLYVFIGALQVLQTLTATIFVPTDLGLVFSPGSSVMFSAGLVGVLLVYLREDAAEARRLILALLAANLAAGALMLLLSIQVQDPSVLNGPGLDAKSLFVNGATLVLGTALLAVDAVLIVVLYEFFARWSRGLFLPMAATLAAVMVFDSVVFITWVFWDAPAPQYTTTLLNSVLSKVFIAGFHALVSAAYLNRFEREQFTINEDGKTREVFAIFTYRQKYEMARREAMYDGLTGLFHRSYFHATAKHDVSICARAEHPLSLLFIDLDHFKQVNDKHGHQAGDAVLRAAATCLAAGRRPSDYVCRYGGEEFVMILPNTGPAGAVAIAEQLRNQIASMRERGLSPVATTASIGVASMPQDGQTLEHLIATADRRLYRAKANGRDRVESEG
ncbi:GGDEF domain-containing protein [Arenimonas sp.]|uniref:GGDEF domain-containing protein n=1 Tax=Arenimonas sp. TaxID=1872635 RepID=UPI0025C68008|nr:GGDEF domain-containing protein [Arenimonas sp.]